MYLSMVNETINHTDVLPENLELSLQTPEDAFNLHTHLQRHKTIKKYQKIANIRNIFRHASLGSV